MSSEPTLKNASDRYRWRPSDRPCPKCGGQAFEDHWPPNYGGGNMAFGGVGSISETSGSVKCVCIPCRIAYRVSYQEKQELQEVGEFKTQAWITVEKKTEFSETVPLEERGGVLLTPADVRDEDYKEEHGEYPQIAFA